MKKFIGIFAATLMTAPIFMSCGGKGVAKIETESDTINYAFGVANANGFKQYIILADTADAKKVQQFYEGFESTFGETDSKKRAANEGLRLGWSLGQEFKTGFLFKDSSIVAKPQLITDMFERVLLGEKWVMDAQSGQDYFYKTMNSMYDAEGNKVNALSESQIDTLNMVMGMVNASMARQFMLGGDTTQSKQIKAFIKAFKKGLDMDTTNNMRMEGMRVGSGLWTNMQPNKGTFLGKEDLEMNTGAIIRGIKESLLTPEKAIMTNNEAIEYLNKMQAREQEKKQKAEAAKYEETKAAGEAFLAENAKRPEITVTESGLQYEVMKEGSGAKPAATDRVKVHYHGTLIDGTVFDSSVDRGEPITFGLDQVIKGWTEGVQLMSVGAKYRFYIPYNLAYGERGAGDDIKPYSALIFEVELLGIEK